MGRPNMNVEAQRSRPRLPLSKMKAASRATSLFASALSAFIGFAFSVAAEDWSQWGGTPARNMYSPAKGLPDHFTKAKSGDIKFKPGTDEVDRANIENLKWVAKIGSQSYANVTVAGGKVFIG